MEPWNTLVLEVGMEFGAAQQRRDRLAAIARVERRETRATRASDERLRRNIRAAFAQQRENDVEPSRPPALRLIEGGQA
jgi:hypothetical protein